MPLFKKIMMNFLKNKSQIILKGKELKLPNVEKFKNSLAVIDKKIK